MLFLSFFMAAMLATFSGCSAKSHMESFKERDLNMEKGSERRAAHLQSGTGIDAAFHWRCRNLGVVRWRPAVDLIAYDVEGYEIPVDSFTVVSDSETGGWNQDPSLWRPPNEPGKTDFSVGTAWIGLQFSTLTNLSGMSCGNLGVGSGGNRPWNGGLYIENSLDGSTWQTVAEVPGSNHWFSAGFPLRANLWRCRNRGDTQWRPWVSDMNAYNDRFQQIVLDGLSRVSSSETGEWTLEGKGWRPPTGQRVYSVGTAWIGLNFGYLTKLSEMSCQNLGVGSAGGYSWSGGLYIDNSIDGSTWYTVDEVPGSNTWIQRPTMTPTLSPTKMPTTLSPATTNPTYSRCPSIAPTSLSPSSSPVTTSPSIDLVHKMTVAAVEFSYDRDAGMAVCDVSVTNLLGDPLDGVEIDTAYSSTFSQPNNPAITQGGNLYSTAQLTSLACTVVDVSLNGYTWVQDNSVSLRSSQILTPTSSPTSAPVTLAPTVRMFTVTWMETELNSGSAGNLGSYYCRALVKDMFGNSISGATVRLSMTSANAGNLQTSDVPTNATGFAVLEIPATQQQIIGVIGHRCKATSVIKTGYTWDGVEVCRHYHWYCSGPAPTPRPTVDVFDIGLD